MFENSRTWSRVSGESPKVLNVHLGYVPEIEVDERQERRSMRWAIIAAILLHVGFFLVRMPFKAERPEFQAPERAVFAVKQLQFKKPEPKQQQVIQPRPKKKTKKIPIPDPTPDEPEPILEEEVDIPVPEIDLANFEIDEFFIPSAGPPGKAPAGPQALRVGGDVSPPVKLSGPNPNYTEEARQGRVQGVVILEAIIDILGNVTEVRVLKGLPLGLSETALQAAMSWKFDPARRGNEPVPVFYNLTVRFSLQ